MKLELVPYLPYQSWQYEISKNQRIMLNIFFYLNNEPLPITFKHGNTCITFKCFSSKRKPIPSVLFLWQLFVFQ